MDLATRIRPRRGLAATVVRIMPRRYSAVTNKAPSAMRAMRPKRVPKNVTCSGSTMGSNGAMSPEPATVKVPSAACTDAGQAALTARN